MKSNYSRKNSVGAISSTSALSKNKNNIKTVKKRNDMSLDGAGINPDLTDDTLKSSQNQNFS